jgi:methionine-rich copper-binding protein CopC
MFRSSVSFLMLSMTMTAHVEAHARLVSSQPSAGSTVAAPLAALTLVFSEAAKVTALTLQVVGGDSPTKLPFSSAEDSVSHSIALPTLVAGAYIVTWHALSDDGHVTSGTVKFSVQSSPPGETKN